MGVSGLLNAAICASLSWSAVSGGVLLGIPSAFGAAHGAGQAPASSDAAGCLKFLKPSVVLIGMGTTSSTLGLALQEHPELSCGKHMEHSLFGIDANLTASYLNKTATSVSEEKYVDEFEVPCSVKRTFDASDNKVMMGQDMKFMANLLRKAVRDDIIAHVRSKVGMVRNMLGAHIKLLTMIRHPLKVAFAFRASKPFDWGWAYCNAFADGLEAWMSVFPRDQFYFLRHDDFLAAPTRHLEKLYKFLEVSPFDTPRLATGPDEKRMENEAELLEAFDMQNQGCRQRLEEMTLLELDWGAGNVQALL